MSLLLRPKLRLQQQLQRTAVQLRSTTRLFCASAAGDGAAAQPSLNDAAVKKCLVFPGQGAQYVGMGKEIYDEHEFIRNFYHECDDILNYKLTEIMFNGPQEDLTQTIYAQPAIFIHTMAVWKLLQFEYGMKITDFQAVMGHSLGELTALTVAEYFNRFEDALNIVNKRAQFMYECCADHSQSQSDANDASSPTPYKQKMLAIINLAGMEMQALMDILQTKLDALLSLQTHSTPAYIAQIATINSSKQIVVSGHQFILDEVIDVLGKEYKKKLKCKYIPTGGSFHTQLMYDGSQKLISELNAIDDQRLKAPLIPVISNVNAKAHTTIASIKQLLGEQVCSAVLWHQSSLECLNEYEITEFIQIGTNAKMFSDLIQQTCVTAGKNETRFCSFDKMQDGWIIK